MISRTAEAIRDASFFARLFMWIKLVFAKLFDDAVEFAGSLHFILKREYILL